MIAHPIPADPQYGDATKGSHGQFIADVFDMAKTNTMPERVCWTSFTESLEGISEYHVWFDVDLFPPRL